MLKSLSVGRPVPGDPVQPHSRTLDSRPTVRELALPGAS